MRTLQEFPTPVRVSGNKVAPAKDEPEKMVASQLLLDGSQELPTPDGHLSTLADFRRVSEAQGGLMRAADAARLVGVSRNAIYELVQRGKLATWDFHGTPFVSVAALEARAAAPRDKGGRPARK